MTDINDLLGMDAKPQTEEEIIKAKGFTHDSANNATVDWYTPKWIFDDLGIDFDLDPCHPKERIPWIPVKWHYSLEDDGLTAGWEGNVWLNPPYGKETTAWLERMHDYRHGIALVFARTDCKWYHNYVVKADGILFLKGRVKFVDGLGKTGGSGAGCGSMLISWGKENTRKLWVMSENDKGHFIKLNDSYF